MSQPDNSYSPPARCWWCILTYDWRGQMRITIPFMAWAPSEEEAARNASGMQLAEDTVRRDILVVPADVGKRFQWVGTGAIADEQNRPIPWPALAEASEAE